MPKEELVLDIGVLVGKPGEILTWDDKMELVWSDGKEFIRKEVEKIEEERLG